ncbi:MAG: peptide chain release factor 2 [Bdellovibrionales bacterium]
MSVSTHGSEVRSQLLQLREKTAELRGIFDIDVKSKRLQELEQKAQNPEVWNNHLEMQKINQEKVLLERAVGDYSELNQKVEDGLVLLDMAAEADDEDSFREVCADLQAIRAKIADLELKSLLNGEVDVNNAYISINSGAGGTEAQDWASMLLRMYTRWAEHEGYKVQILSLNDGEEAGIKSATLLVEGPYAYGYLKAEAGVHRLVRISPFDSNARRHTSFASVYAWPEIDDNINIEIDDADLRIDTYRSSGAGGQHVNRTDSAVRITHIPSGIVVQCQQERSQHMNRDKAFKMLRSALYEKELERRQKELDAIAGERKANEWGSQIRSYVLHPYQLAKDHRTDFETGNPAAVLDGELNGFIHAYLRDKALAGKAAQ